MRIDRLAALDNESLIVLARRAGLVVLAGGLLFTMKATEGPGDGGPFWKAMAYGLPYGVSGALVFFSAERLRPAEERSRAPVMLIGLFVAGHVALALKVSDTRMAIGSGDTGIWGFINVLFAGGLSGVVLLWLVAVTTQSLQTRLLVGVTAALAFLLVHGAIEIHTPESLFLSDFWDFLWSWPGVIARSALLIVAAVYPRSLRQWSGLVWLLAVALTLAAVASSWKLAEGLPSDAWWGPVAIVNSRLTFVLLLLAFARVVSPRAVLAGAIVLVLTALVYTCYQIVVTLEGSDASFWAFLLQMLAIGSPAALAVMVAEVGVRVPADDMASEAHANAGS